MPAVSGTDSRVEVFRLAIDGTEVAITGGYLDGATTDPWRLVVTLPGRLADTPPEGWIQAQTAIEPFTGYGSPLPSQDLDETAEFTLEIEGIEPPPTAQPPDPLAPV